MGANTFGRLFSVTTFGESHGPAIGCVIDGCPPGVAINADKFRHDLARRATGKSIFTSQRRESDEVEILSGVFRGLSTGHPIALLIRNVDARSNDYDDVADQFRPGHADFTYQKKYGLRDPRGGGRSSARETTMRVAAAVVAKQILADRYNIVTKAYVSQIGDLFPQTVDLSVVESNPFFWPDMNQIPALESFMDGLRTSGDSVGGAVTVIAENVPVGWGEPVYGKLDAELAAAFMSINAVKSVEIGDGVDVAAQRGSEHRDEMNETGFLSNHAGGILGGISTGQTISARMAIKPTSSITVPGHSISSDGARIEIVTKGRHDPCVALRAPPIAEAMMALVLLDHEMRHRAQCG
jgi:chorismate synthase